MVEILCETVSNHDCGSAARHVGDVQPKECKREESLVDPADHDTSILFPVRYIAVVLQSRTHIPSQKAPADRPN